MSASIVITAFISVFMTAFLAIFSMLIYERTTGASKAYYFWALSAAFLLMGSLISFASSFFMDPNAKEVQGTEGFVAVIFLSFYLIGYFYLALGATFLPGELRIIHVNLEKIYNLRKFVFVAILVMSSFVTSLLHIIGDKIPVGMFYYPIYTIIWLYCFFIILPLHKAVRDYVSYWIYFLLASVCGFLGNLSEILAYFVLDELAILLPLWV